MFDIKHTITSNYYKHNDIKLSQRRKYFDIKHITTSKNKSH